MGALYVLTNFFQMAPLVKNYRLACNIYENFLALNPVAELRTRILW